ncbi:MAG: TonB-dependent receptor, partial [Acidobacteria bacterium]|nr:TonB-dependent receptor [Acidobacteriota bacterium]
NGKASPDFSQTLTTGGTVGNLGSVFSFTYSRKFQRLLETVNSYQALGSRLIPWNLFVNDKNTETVKMGFVGNLSYRLGQDHKLLWKNFYTRDSSDETRFLEGFSNGNTADERDTRLRYLTERIFTTQVSGEHYVRPLGSSLLEWRTAYSQAFRGEPDLRETIYRSEEGKNSYRFSPEGQSGFRQFSDQKDRIYEPGLDWSFYLIRDNFNATFKFGGLYQQRTRDFSSRRFVFLILDRSIDLRQSPEQLFRSENIVPNRIELREITRFTDTYDAEQDVYAGYAMADVVVAQKWRFLGGLRYEKSQIALKTFDPNTPGLAPLLTNLDNVDPLPAASAVYIARPSMNIRGGYSRTLNRPEFRELAPFQFTDISGRSTILGNPLLKQARIDNFDLRWEWFPGGMDLVAVSAFSKRFDKPIERVLFYAADVLTSFANTDFAASRGFELELKKKLGFVSGALENFTIYSNYTRVHSKVEIGEIPGLVLTTRERPLQGQANYIYNGVLEYANDSKGTDVRLLYNLVGRRISGVGATGLPDVYEQPNHFLDVSVGKRIPGWERVAFKFAATNLLNRAITELQGSRVFYRYKLGRGFSFGLSFDIY